MSYFILGDRIIQGVAFDMDGTLIDCEPVNRAAVEAAAGRNIRIDWANCAGKKEEIIHGILKEEYGPDKIRSTADEFVAACKRGYQETMGKLKAREGIIELLNTFQGLNIPMIVVTNTERGMAIQKLEQCGLQKFMVDVIGSDTLENLGLKSKPSGDGYRLAASQLQIKEEDMMGFEDSLVGMDALSQTAAFSVHITDYGTPAHVKAGLVLSGSGGGALLTLNNKIRHHNTQALLGFPPQPRSPAYTG